MAVTFTNCDSFLEDEIRDYQEFRGKSYGIIATESNKIIGFYDLTDVAGAFSGYTITFIEDGAQFQSAEVFVSFNGGARVSTGTVVSTNPADITLTLQDATTTLGIDPNTLVIGDDFVYSYDVTTTTGEVFANSLRTSVKTSCASDFGGTMDYVSSNLQAANGYGCPVGNVAGTVTFTDQGGGTYLISDLGFGQYESSCWNDGPATSAGALISDVCNSITTGGLDQYSLVYIWNITDVTGDTLSLSWTNNYGDSGDTVLTRQDGNDWPALTTN